MEHSPSTIETMEAVIQPQPGPLNEPIKPELKPESSPHPTPEVAQQTSSSKSPSHPPLPSTEPPNMTAQSTTTTTTTTTKKKGIASTVKRAPKRPKNGTSRPNKKPKSDVGIDGLITEDAQASEDDEEEGDGEEESDHGPYCICRGPDDHRWMIFCENCEDWFHGECINLNKEIGESLIETFVCPNCTNRNIFTLYKKTCALGGCRKASRLNSPQKSVFCSQEHAHTYWERLVSRLPKARSKGGLSDHLIQEEFMALLGGGLATTDEEGLWSLARAPFSNPSSNGVAVKDEDLSGILSSEETKFLNKTENARLHLAEETLLCHKMLSLIELAQERRRAAITAGRFGEDICGYDQRLDTICARDAFAAFVKSPEGEVVFKTSKLGDPLAEDDEVRGMCEKKRCKIHSGWYKMLVLGIKHQIREMAAQAAEVSEEEKVVREAAGERFQRRKAERNWVEVLDE